MALETGPPRSLSPESSGRDTPTPRQWRNQLSAEDISPKDRNYRKYASGVERALSLFDTALEEWADYISFLSKLLKALQARPANTNAIPSKALVAKRLSQCLDPSLPSGVHQKAIEVYGYIFSVIGQDGLSRDLPLYLSGLAPTLSFASLAVRTRYLELLEKYLLHVQPRMLRPALKAIIMALLPGLEDETSEDFDRTLHLVESFKKAIRPSDSQLLTAAHSTGDDFFWQCFFLAAITNGSRRPGALAYLSRNLPRLGNSLGSEASSIGDDDLTASLSDIVTSPEPGLLLRCFAAGLGDEQILIQRGFLDLLVSNLPLHSKVLQKQVKPDELELLLRAAAGVVIRRDMSLNRRLWAWFLGPEKPQQGHETDMESPSSALDHHRQDLSSKTSYFEKFGLQPLTRALLSMIQGSSERNSPSEKAKPYRICLSLMDRWEIGGLVVPEIFLPVITSVRDCKRKGKDESEFGEVLRSASVFFDGVESGLIYGELVGLLAQAIGPGEMSPSERADKLALVQFIMAHFNVREEEMVTLHAPLAAVAVLAMVGDVGERTRKSKSLLGKEDKSILTQALCIAMDMIDLVPERVFTTNSRQNNGTATNKLSGVSMPNSELLENIKHFYMSEQGNLEVASLPFPAGSIGELLMQKSSELVCSSLTSTDQANEVSIRTRLLVHLLSKVSCSPDTAALLSSMHRQLANPSIPFLCFKSVLLLAVQLYNTDLIESHSLSRLVAPLVRHAWGFLSASEPKYHVETVKCLWQLQSALTASSRDIEAAIADIMLQSDTTGTFATRAAEPGRTFCLLWSHTLHDNAAYSDRRAPKTPLGEPQNLFRLSGMDYYDVMLSRPLFLMLDALSDELTQLSMVVKNWLNNVVGIEKLFLVFVKKISQLQFLQNSVRKSVSSTSDTGSVEFSEDDDLDMALYYLRTFSNVLRCAPDALWGVLATRTLEEPGSAVWRITGSEGDVSFQEFFVHVCLRCVAGNKFSPDAELQLRVAQLHRGALTLLHQILSNPYAEGIASLKLEIPLIDRLTQSLDVPDPYIQVLLLDVVLASLKLRDASLTELQNPPIGEKRAPNYPSGSIQKTSISVEHIAEVLAPPPSLLKCIQSGLGSPGSRPVLDSWVGFLAEILPLYSNTIFQVLIPLVETLCEQIGSTFGDLQKMFNNSGRPPTGSSAPEPTLFSLLNALEQVLARAHDRLLAEESRTQVAKSPEHPQGFFGNMVSGVFTSDLPQSRSATANDRLTVLLAFQDAVRICFKIWSWGQGREATQLDPASGSSFKYTSLRMRNRARRLLEHVFAAEALECLETVIDIWRTSAEEPGSTRHSEVFNLLPALDGSRPRHTIPAIFNAIYSRTNPTALEPSRKSTMTVSLQDTDLVIFLVDYARSLEDDAMDEIWQDCMVFLRDLLGNPFPHRQTLPSLLEFAAILGEKVDNTNFGEQRKMRRELGDLFLRLLTALFTTRPASFADTLSGVRSPADVTNRTPSERADDVVGVLSRIVPNLPKILVEPDRVLTAAQAIATSLIGPSIRSKGFPETITKTSLTLLQELTRLPNNQKTWKKDVADAFNDARFFNSSPELVESDWLPLFKLWTVTDKDRITEILSRISAPTTAGIVFGVGATSARLEADRRTQLNLRRIATLVLACEVDTLVTDLPAILEHVVGLLGATATSSPSSTTRADIYMVLRALVLRTSTVHLAPLWPIITSELHMALSSAAAPDNSAIADTYNNMSILHACKLLDVLIAVAPDDFQLHQWLFITDTIDSIYRSATYQPVALVDELSEELGSAAAAGSALQTESVAIMASSPSGHRHPLLGPGGIDDELTTDRRDELITKILRPFFGQLSIYAFESTYAMGALGSEGCVKSLLKDLFDEKSIVRAL
ncbi:putative regulator of reproduction dopa [Xylariaceae sp. FL0594]|nr:putative regulator of reproduction dopa [Xylariaceae sp. FL0594]